MFDLYPPRGSLQTSIIFELHSTHLQKHILKSVALQVTCAILPRELLLRAMQGRTGWASQANIYVIDSRTRTRD